MSAHRERGQLRSLATRLGIQTWYRDTRGRRQNASDDALVGVIRALGVPIDGPGGAAVATEALADPAVAALVPDWTATGSSPAPKPLPPPPATMRAVIAPWYALRRGDDHGIGTLDHLQELADLLAVHGVGVLLTLPMLATAPGEASPYLPLSRQAWSERIIDLTRLPGEIAPPPRPSGRSIDYAAVDRCNDESLTAATRVAAETPQQRDEVEAFAEQRPDLAAYARYRAGLETAGGLPGSPGPGREWRYLYGQFEADRQLAELNDRLSRRGQRLGLDLPIGCHPEGFEVRAHPEQFAQGVSAGAPPDDFFSEGQRWGFPPLHPGRSSAAGHSVFAAAVRHHVARAGLLRVDHVMGFHRLWWIPDGLDAADGAYVRYPAEELYGLLAREAAAHGTIVVGEDLGTVPREIRRALRRSGLLGMWELQFALGADADVAPKVPAGTVAGLNTHDMEPWAAFCAAHPEAVRAHLGRCADAGEALDRALDLLLGSGAAVVTASLEDLWLETEPQNVPGTTDDERPNWRRRTRPALEEMPAMADVTRRLDTLARRDPTDPPFTDLDQHLLNEGTHRHLHRVLGAQPDNDGCWFSVWAPNAERVAVVGDFNDWGGETHRLEPVGSSGVWTGRVLGAEIGHRYKYRIDQTGGRTVDKADPLAARSEEPPATASVIARPEHDWGDGEWMRTRGERNRLDAPISIYEVHLGSWRRSEDPERRFATYHELAEPLADHALGCGFTHVELLPVTEHPFYGSWGYQTTGYFAPTARYGSPEDLMALVDHLHQRGLGVICDWVPSHFPDDEHGLARFDGTALYEHADRRLGHHPDWDSLIFNYGRHEVRSFLVSSAICWLERFHIDGIRVDAVASMLYRDYSRSEGQWLPNEYGGRENIEAITFLRELNEAIYEHHPDVQTYAEESTAWPMVSRPTYLGGLGFGFKWDMGWMHDTLVHLSRDPIHRQWHHHEMTFRAIYMGSENYVLPLSHDEVVHGKGSLLAKMPGDDWQQRANLRLLLGWQWCQPGKKLLFMGGELGQPEEWDHETWLRLDLLDDPRHEGIRRWLADLNQIYATVPALHELDTEVEAGFRWVVADDAANGVLAFLRRARDGSPALVVANTTPVVRQNHRVGVPSQGRWRELANSDAEPYGGSGAGNLGAVETHPVPAHGHFHSLVLTLPALAVLVLAPEI